MTPRADLSAQTASTATPVAAMMGAILSVQLGAATAKGLFSSLGAEGTTALRLAFGALILAIGFRPWRSPPRREAWAALVGYGLTMGAMNLCFYMALARIPLGVAVTVEFIGPLGVALASSRRRLDFLWLGLTVAGLVLLAPSPAAARLDPLGVGFALAAGACWAGYILFGKRVGGEHGSQAVAIGAAVGALAVLPVGLASAGLKLFDPALAPRALMVGALSSAIPYTLEMVALTRIPARTYGTLVSAEPAVAALIGLVLLGERLAMVQWVAVGAIVVASAGATLAMGRAKLPLLD